MKHIIAIIFLLFVLACQPAELVEINSFEECVKAGNPVMESYPRQCRANGQTFVEEIEGIPPPTPEEELPNGEPFEEKPAGLAAYTECTEKADFCTAQYDPVCGIVDNGVRCVTAPCQSTDAKTFSNGCNACSNDAFGHYPGECSEQTFVVCKETVTGFSAEEFAANNNGICVDICPGNYDPYVTQIGVELCIEHAGEEEISQWKVCEKSSANCNCVKAYETTTGEQIEEAEYRCVPDTYASRLLFRGGQDRLDQNGERGVVIA